MDCNIRNGHMDVRMITILQCSVHIVNIVRQALRNGDNYTLDVIRE